MEISATIIALSIAVAASTFILVLSVQLGWCGHLLADVILASVIVLLILLAWPETLPLWFWLFYWCVAFVGLRWWAQHNQYNTVLTYRQSNAVTYPSEISKEEIDDIEEWFDFEDISA